MVFQLLLRPISNESAKDFKKPLVTGSKDPSVAQGSGEDQGGGPSETKPVVSISSTQLVYVVADLDKLQEQVGLCPGRIPGAHFSVATESSMCKDLTPYGLTRLRIVRPRGTSREHVHLPSEVFLQFSPPGGLRSSLLISLVTNWVNLGPLLPFRWCCDELQGSHAAQFISSAYSMRHDH